MHNAQETYPDLSDPPVNPHTIRKEKMILNDEAPQGELSRRKKKHEIKSEDKSEEEKQVASFPKHHDDAFKLENCMSHCFILNMEIDVTNDPKTFLKTTSSCINKTLSSMQ